MKINGVGTRNYAPNFGDALSTKQEQRYKQLMDELKRVQNQNTRLVEKDGAIENGDVANINGCFMCKYIADLFSVIGDATELFWTAILDGLLILIALGFGIYMTYTGVAHVWAAAKSTAGTKVDEKKIKSAGVAGVIRPGKTSVQVVVGTKVQFVADEFKKLCK